MRIGFPYPGVSVEAPDANLMGIFGLPRVSTSNEAAILRRAMENPIGTSHLRDLACDKQSVLIVCDDVARPTPAWKIIPAVLDDLHRAGVEDENIECVMALGTHRPMTAEEMRAKVGRHIFARFPVHNHEWSNPDALEYMGKTSQGAEVWINKKVAQADLVIGVGRIMPIEVCGFTGGGKILIPGCCGEITNSDMHWARVDVDSREIIGKRDNPIRAAIDSLARQAGLDFIVNIIMDSAGNIFDCVAGDLVEAHREGCSRALAFHQVHIPQEADIVIVDGWPFDIEFWQVNKALDTAGLVVRSGGAVICVSPCHEGLSRSHAGTLLQYGYPSKPEIKRLVESGAIPHKVVGVHMMQVREVIDRADVYLVTNGIPQEDLLRVGLHHAATPQEALERAFARLGTEAKVAVLRGAAEMLPLVAAN